MLVMITGLITIIILSGLLSIIQLGAHTREGWIVCLILSASVLLVSTGLFVYCTI